MRLHFWLCGKIICLYIRVQEASMVSKCANSECSAPFLYFHRGRLFRLETEGRQDRRRHLGDEIGKKPLRRLEFYWLCDDCAGKMTLTFDKVSGISVQPRPATPAPTGQATASAA